MIFGKAMAPKIFLKWKKNNNFLQNIQKGKNFIGQPNSNLPSFTSILDNLKQHFKALERKPSSGAPKN